MTDWFRSWHGAPTDNKWLLIAKRAGVKPIHVSGTWWALLDHASQHSERGFVGDFDIETFALFAGMEEEHVSRIVTTLRDKGMIVDDRIGQWGKRQPKREDETAGARQRRHRQENGGKPPPQRGADIPDDGQKSERHAMSRIVTIEEKRGEENSSVADATGTVVPHPASDFCKAIFDSGKALLARGEMTSRQAGSLLGRLRKQCGDAELLILIRQAETEAYSDPAAWLVAAVETRNGNRKPDTANLRGSRPDPALDLGRYADRLAQEEAAIGNREADFGAGASLPSYLTG
jgi:hypothetical protein